jgi:hypothetical protein
VNAAAATDMRHAGGRIRQTSNQAEAEPEAVCPMDGIRISDTHMSSPDTPHTAIAIADGWKVSWLSGHTLDRNQAITAMTIATIVGGRGVGLSEDPIWPHLDNWAAELGLSGADAVIRASEPPGTREAGTSNEPEPQRE